MRRAARNLATSSRKLLCTLKKKARRGAKPLGLPGYYPPDEGTYRNYARMAQTKQGFQAFMDEFLANGSKIAAE